VKGSWLDNTAVCGGLGLQADPHRLFDPVAHREPGDPDDRHRGRSALGGRQASAVTGAYTHTKVVNLAFLNGGGALLLLLWRGLVT
jgi:hypothetical protein